MKILAPRWDASIPQGGVWPTETQELLLRAALLDAPDAGDAWVRWQEVARTDAMDIASWKLIPLVYANLKRLRVEDPLLEQAKACHLQHWVQNQRLFHLSSQFLKELEALEIPTVVLKGVALASLYYPDTGSRPMADLDVLVPPAKFLALGKRLGEQGWQATDGYSFDGFEMDKMPSFGFIRADGFSVDIHCHVLHTDCSAGADDAFWAGARPFAVKDVKTLTLAPEDHLLHVVSHGVRWCDVSPFRWIADAWWILTRSRSGFNWERFMEQTRAHEIELPILGGLERMRGIVPVDIPADVPARLKEHPASAGARVRYVVAITPLPKEFFPRGVAIWKALAEEKGPASGGKFLRLLSLLVFACEVTVRERRQIFAEARAWVRRLFKKA